MRTHGLEFSNAGFSLSLGEKNISLFVLILSKIPDYSLKHFKQFMPNRNFISSGFNRFISM